VLEPGELLIDGRLLHLVEGEAGAHAIEQIVVVLAVVVLPFARHARARAGALAGLPALSAGAVRRDDRGRPRCARALWAP
jgi:hypothetical protein